MAFLGESARYVHVLFGAIGLIAFWVPVFTAKGAKVHTTAGKVFVWSAYVVVAGAGIALISRVTNLLSRGIGPADEPALFAFIVFLTYLTFITFVIVRHGVGVLANKRDPAALRTNLNVGLAYGAHVASAAIVLYAIVLSPPNRILLFALSPIGFANGYGILRYINGSVPSKRAWMYEHIGAMLGAGIAFHTAFAVFGASRLFDIGLSGWVSVIPWILPTIVGAPAIAIWTRHYRRKFGELA